MCSELPRGNDLVSRDGVLVGYAETRPDTLGLPGGHSSIQERKTVHLKAGPVFNCLNSSSLSDLRVELRISWMRGNCCAHQIHPCLF